MPTSLQLTRLLVPLDGSTLAETVIPLAEQIARDHDAEVMLLEVLEGRQTPRAEMAAEPLNVTIENASAIATECTA